MAETIKELEMYPYFYCANFIHKSSIIRDDSCPENFSRDHPFASYISTMVACFAGKMLANGLLGLPIVDPWGESANVLLATIMWYLMNYSPFDIFHTFTAFMPVELVLGIMVEIFRCNRIYEGVNLAFDKYDSSPLIILSIGTICGNGIRFIELAHRLVRGLWTPNEVEFMMPTCNTRASFLVSLIFWAFHDDITPCLYTMALFLLLVLKCMCFWVGNPYFMLENLIYQLTIGVWDFISRLLSKKGMELPEIQIELPDSTEIIPGPAPAPAPEPSPCSSAVVKRPRRESRSRSRSRKRSCSRKR